MITDNKHDSFLENLFTIVIKCHAWHIELYLASIACKMLSWKLLHEVKQEILKFHLMRIYDILR